MNIIVIGKNVEITSALKAKASAKLSKLEKYFKAGTEVVVTMGVQKERHIVEVTIPFHGVLIRAEVESEDMYASIDQVVDVLEGQIRKNRTRINKRIHESHALKAEDFDEVDGLEDVEDEQEEEFKIVRTKKFAPKPMSEEEAILQMNLIGHAFFVFSNAETNQVNVVYKRKNGNYGLIEPEF